MDNEESTIFIAPQSMSSEERSAVKSGEERGKRAAIAERPEHYGCIGSEDTVKASKGFSMKDGKCRKKGGCDHFTGSDGMDYCDLPKNVRCVA